MRKARMKRSLLSRLQLLQEELTPDGWELPSLRIGLLRQLPPDFTGERHVALVRTCGMEGDRQWCEFEERPGPRPPGPVDPVPWLPVTETRLRIAGDPIDELDENEKS
jgi:hypothetical protein